MLPHRITTRFTLDGSAIEGILSAVGRTPLVRLSRMFKDVDFNLYAKVESLNPGGSMKDRPALLMVLRAFESGAIRPGSVIIESSSGNMGIGLAQVCAYYGLRFICVVDPKTMGHNLKLLRAYGAEVDLVREADSATGEYIQARLNRVRELLRAIPNSVSPDQYVNLNNAAAHHETMSEISKALNGRVDVLFCATSTCGTLRGCSEYIRKKALGSRIVAVDAIGSVIFGGKCSKRLIPGHGSAVRPPLFRADLADEFVQVSDIDCIVGCRRLALQEAILAGGSSGALIAAIERVRHTLPAGSNCVAIFPDRGERYLDTIYSNEWVSEHFGDISHLWSEWAAGTVCMPAAMA
jgi:2,3-diaminopropionate biosynthesis protein SbnA